jgi:BolA family transcriptional regulator, general stress-responsive regulator
MEVKKRIESKLKSAFLPQHLEVVNESQNHNVPKGSETHFKVLLVSKAFESKSLVQRHRWVYELLAEEMKGGVHALSLHTHTPEEWIHSPAFRKSPPCLGGSSDES